MCLPRRKLAALASRYSIWSSAINHTRVRAGDPAAHGNLFLESAPICHRALSRAAAAAYISNRPRNYPPLTGLIRGGEGYRARARAVRIIIAAVALLGSQKSKHYELARHPVPRARAVIPCNYFIKVPIYARREREFQPTRAADRQLVRTRASFFFSESKYVR